MKNPFFPTWLLLLLFAGEVDGQLAYGQESTSFKAITDQQRHVLSVLTGADVRWVYRQPTPDAAGKYSVKATFADSVFMYSNLVTQQKAYELFNVFAMYTRKSRQSDLDSVGIDLYVHSDSLHTSFSASFPLAAAHANTLKVIDQLNNFFDLCAGRRYIYKKGSSLYAYFNATTPFTTSTRRVFGAYVLYFSVFITKYIDGQKRDITDLYATCTDPNGEAESIHYSATNATYLQWENLL